MSEQAARKFYLKQFRAISNAIATYEDFNLLVRHLVEGVCRTFNIDGFVKSPISALRCIPSEFHVLYGRCIPRDLRRLDLELFTLPSQTDFLRGYQLLKAPA